MRPRSGASGPGEHMHQRRLAGAVVADEADAFAGIDGEIDAVERADGAEMLFDAVQLDDVCACPRHHRQWLKLRADDEGAPRSRAIYFMFALIAACASSWVYSWLATLPFSMVGSAASKSSWVKAR